ncbi:MAG: S1 RNA-binding domain-containing protein [Lachnospiraceae bacterium]|nr:S1 RNA-binding domain-containing protein [Lachnospiraceae bacterium]
MIRLGEKQRLRIAKRVDFGLYLEDMSDKGAERVLLPAKYAPKDAQPGEEITVFIYLDSEDRPVATTRTPLLKLGEVALLKVVSVTKIGAFLDWGLEKDLFLPYKEMTYKVEAGDEALVTLYIDRSHRLCARMNVYENLEKNAPYKKDDIVTGRVYEDSNNFGAFVAVDNKYSALIQKKELYGDVSLGMDISARVTEVSADGRLLLSIREKGYAQIEKDAEKLRELLKSYEGVLPFNDKAKPETIFRETGMSKKEFKRAVGHLLKNGEITIGERNIKAAGRR